MNKYFIILIIFSFSIVSAFSQNVQIQIFSPGELTGRKALLVTQEKGFASIVHSIKLSPYPINLQMDQDLLPDLYRLNVAQIKGSLSFFLEPGTQIYLDTTDLAKSVVIHSKSNPQWKLFYDSIQQPSNERLTAYSSAETRARKQGNTDSLNYWIDKKVLEKEELLDKTSEFILKNPGSFVSLYLLKNNWFTLKNKRIFEKLDVSLAGHRNYKLLKGKSL